MPRKPMTGPERIQLIDKMSLGAIVSTFPRSTVEDILDATQTNSKRKRLLPSFLVVYLVIMMSLYPNVSIKEALRMTLEKIRNFFGAKQVKIAVGSAITKARRRLGIQPFELLYEEVVRSEGDRVIKESYYRKWLVVGVDGSSMEVQNTQENRKCFGSYVNQYGSAGNPSLKMVILGECETRIIFGIRTGGATISEKELFLPLIEKLKKDMILLADRLYYDYETWKKCNDRGCALLWRLRSDQKLKAFQKFQDGSYLSEIKPSRKMRRKLGIPLKEKTIVRAIEYKAKFGDKTESDTIRLITNILDAEEAPADELAALYARRWQIETAYDELKTSLGEFPRILRSQIPELVIQELYGFFMVYYIVRKLMAEAAKKGGVAISSLSFIHSVRVIRRKVTGTFFPSDESP